MTTREMVQEMMIKVDRRNAVAKRITNVPSDHRVSNIAKGNYRLVTRFTEFMPYVVVYNYDFETHSWEQGHYFNNYDEAIDFMYAFG